MTPLRMDDPHQKEMVKCFEQLCGRFGRWEIWTDFVTMAAITISNGVDRSNAPEREETYKTIAGKYDKQELEVFSAMFAELVMGMDDNTDQDFLGDLYMRLNLNNEHVGQFFTPYNLCKLMAKLQTENIREQTGAKGWFAVNDPACGAGALLVALLVALANECREHGINYQTDVLFIAQDIDYIVGLMCYIQLSLMGCPGYVCIADTLSKPSLAVDRNGLIPVHGPNIWYTPFYFLKIWSGRRMCARMDMMFQHADTKRSEPPRLQETKSGQLTFL